MYVSTSPLCVAVRVRSISFAFVGFTVVVIFLCPWTEYRTLENKDCCWECGGDVQMWWGCSNVVGMFKCGGDVQIFGKNVNKNCKYEEIGGSNVREFVLKFVLGFCFFPPYCCLYT